MISSLLQLQGGTREEESWACRGPVRWRISWATSKPPSRSGIYNSMGERNL